jgi:hypothetical protein
MCELCRHELDSLAPAPFSPLVRLLLVRRSGAMLGKVAVGLDVAAEPSWPLGLRVGQPHGLQRVRAGGNVCRWPGDTAGRIPPVWRPRLRRSTLTGFGRRCRPGRHGKGWYTLQAGQAPVQSVQFLLQLPVFERQQAGGIARGRGGHTRCRHGPRGWGPSHSGFLPEGLLLRAVGVSVRIRAPAPSARYIGGRCWLGTCSRWRVGQSCLRLRSIRAGARRGGGGGGLARLGGAAVQLRPGLPLGWVPRPCVKGLGRVNRRGERAGFGFQFQETADAVD